MKINCYDETRKVVCSYFIVVLKLNLRNVCIRNGTFRDSSGQLVFDIFPRFAKDVTVHFLLRWQHGLNYSFNVVSVMR